MLERDIRWKWLLLGLCTLALVILFSQFLDFTGFGGRPWFGFWDDTYASTTQPYVVAVYQPRAGGASDLAGLRDGDGQGRCRDTGHGCEQDRELQPEAGAECECVIKACHARGPSDGNPLISKGRHFPSYIKAGFEN